MKIAVCEDEQVYSDGLVEALKEYFSAKNIRTEINVFRDGSPLIETYENGKRYDLIFLDIRLESSDGMETAAALRDIDPDVFMIFVTSIEDRAVEGYSVRAFDYIIKDSLDKRLPGVLDRFIEMGKSSFLTFQTAEGDTAVIPCSEVLHIESEGRCTAINTTDGVVVSAMPVSKTAELLPPEMFVEVHKSIFVHTTKIKRVGTDTVEMCNGSVLPLSRRKRKQVLSAVMAAVKGGLK